MRAGGAGRADLTLTGKELLWFDADRSNACECYIFFSGNGLRRKRGFRANSCDPSPARGY